MGAVCALLIKGMGLRYVVETLVGRFGGSIEPLRRSKGPSPVDEMEKGVELRSVIEFDAVIKRPASLMGSGCRVCCGLSMMLVRLCVRCCAFEVD